MKSFGRMSGQWLLSIFCLSLTLFDIRAAVPEEKASFHLFLLVGQSNMAGRGELDELARTPHPRVLSLAKDGTWVPAVDPLHFDKPRIVGVGPGRAFAEALVADQPDVTIGLIPCAVGGSPISTWLPGAYYTATKSHPWDDAIKRAKKAMEVGVLKGILWHQGESDSKPGLSDTYEKSLHDLVARFRVELNAPNVPFVVGQMGVFAERPWTAEKHRVDQAHRDLPGRVPHSEFVDASSLEHKGDEVHFSTQSARILGRRYYEAWKTLSSQR